MPFITQGKANIKYILIVVVLAAIVGGGVLAYQYWWIPKKEVEAISFLDESLNKIETINSLSYQKTFFYKGQLDMKQSVWIKEEGGKTKIKYEDDRLSKGIKITLLDSSEGFLYLYSPGNNFAEVEKIGNITGVEGTKESFSGEIKRIKNCKPVIVSKEILDGKNCLVVKCSTGPIEKAWIWIDYGIVIKEKEGKIYETVLGNIEVNINLPDDLFKLPAGMQIKPLAD